MHSCAVAEAKLTQSLYPPDALEPQVDIRAPAVQALHGHAPAKVLGVGPAQRQPIPQPGDRAPAVAGVGDDVQRVDAGAAGAYTAAAAVAAPAATARQVVVLGHGRERVRPYVGQDLRADTAAAVADADGHAGGVVVEGPYGVAAGGVPRRGRRRGLVVARGGLRGDGDDDGLPSHVALDGGAEGVLEQLRDDVLEVVGDEGEGGVRVAVDLPARADAVLELADVGDELAARVDDARGPQVGVDDADEGGVVGAGRRRGARVEVRLGREVKRDVLLGNEPGADARAQVLVQEAGDLGRANVPPALEEALRQDGDGVGVGVDQLGQDFSEADLILERGEGVLALG